MRYVSLGLLLSAVTLTAVPVEAQSGRGRGGPSGARGAEFFLARTGDLRLTDAQVVRLAAIARRSADRRRLMRASMDSVAPARRGVGRMDSTDRAARMREMEAMRVRFDREREQARADLRDAIAVLTPDQQAMVWEMTVGPPGGRAARGSRFRREGAPRRERRQRGAEGRQPLGTERPPQ